MRFVKKDFSNPIARGILESNTARTHLDDCIENQDSSHFKGTIYGHETVREQLSYIYHDKCCYCEVNIRPISTPHIEHFRPKGRVTGLDGPGYYWLGYEWTNLLLACPACNSIKGTKFPLNLDNHIISHPIDGNMPPTYAMIPVNAGYLNKERPLIINPEVIHPEGLFYFDYLCFIRPVKENTLATTTIKEIDLNRDDLVADRQEKVDDIINKIENQLFVRYSNPGLTDIQFYEQLKLIFADIVIRMDASQEYSLLGINMVERFVELILEDIDEFFHEELLNQFIQYLQNPE